MNLENVFEGILANVSEEKADMYRNGMNRKEAALKLIGLIIDNGNEPILIKSRDGEEARLSRNSVNKLVSETSVKKSVNNGFTAAQHFAVASDIDNLFRNSVKVLTHADRNNDPNVVAMHRFATTLFGDNTAYITVKEATEQGKRIYSVELIELGKLEGILNETRLKSSSNPASSFPTDNIHFFSEKNNKRTEKR